MSSSEAGKSEIGAIISKEIEITSKPGLDKNPK